MSIKLVSTGGGSVTIQEPNTASDFTLSVPAATANILTNKTAGTVLQVVSANYNTYSSTASTSLVSSGLTVSITPTSASSKILVIVNPLLAVLRNSGTGMASLQIVRGATSIYSAERTLAIDTGSFMSSNISITVLDSPATTSSTTYTLNYACGSAGTGGVRLNDYNSTSPTIGSTITLMEIAA